MSTGNTPRARAKDALQELGYRPEIDTDGDLKYRSDGIRLYAKTDPDDPAYFQVYCACEGDASTADKRHSTLEVADRIAKKWKCAKMMVFNEGVYVADEFLVPPGGDITYVLERATRTVTGAAKAYLSDSA